jgi:transposase-like protein
VEVQELRALIENSPRIKDGRLKLSAELKAAIVETFNEAGLGTTEFAEATGLSLITIYKLRKRANQKLRSGIKNKTKSLFNEVSVIKPMAVYQVAGPKGLRIDMTSVEQVTELWRALC